MDPIIANLVVELVEKMGLLRRDMLLKKEIERYEARLARIEQKLSALAEHLSAEDPDLAKRLRTAWQMPARSLAFRNAEHQKDLKSGIDGAEGPKSDVTQRISSAGHVTLIGDSVFDNKAYTKGEPDVVGHLRTLLPAGWEATLLAVDGSRMTDVPRQLAALPQSVTHIVMSAGGNDALLNSDLLAAPSRTSADTLRLFSERLQPFDAGYRQVLGAVTATGRRTTTCTIYNGALDPDQATLARVALMTFNDVILRAAFAQRVDVIDLRLICADRSDYANPIEPSGSGGLKIAQAIARAVTLAPLDGVPRVIQ